MKRRIHKNSLKAYASLKLEPVERAVLTAYEAYETMTDALAAEVTCPRNQRLVSRQPRITHLLKKKLLKEIGSVKSIYTGRSVRVCKITALGRKALKK